jgi:hypothetical protein
METTLFRWIHISDIHVGHGDNEHGWDQKLVMDGLRKDAAALVKNGQAPVDAILVTGDIAFSGNGRKPTEYADAKEWLLGLGQAAGVTPASIYLVPGNHDVNRAADKDRSTKRLVDTLRSGTDKIDTALGDKGDRELLARRMEAYLAFSAEFAPACLHAPPLAAEERLFWVHRLEARSGLKVRLVGLNTALLAADEEDQSHLRLGKEQLSRALRDPSIEEDELVMVLSHHPFTGGWLADQREVDAWVRNHTHVHLSGHVHDADTEAARKGSGGVFVRIVAGSVHGDQLPADIPASHGYSFGAVVVSDDGKPRLRIWPRKWSSKQMRFIFDAESVPEDERYAEHELRLKLPPAASPAQAPTSPAQPQPQPQPQASTSPRIAPGRPVNVFISFSSADEALETELEKQLKPLARKNIISISTNTGITAGEDWKDALKRNIESAQMILLLLSPDYLASEECYEVEMPAAHRQATTRGALVIPILLRPTSLSELWSNDDTEKAWFERLGRLPRDGRPVTKWPDRDEALAQIAREIRKLAENLRSP